MRQTTIFDQAASVAAGERGMAIAAGNLATWRQLAEQWVLALPRGGTFTADDLTAAVERPTEVDGNWTNNGIGGLLNGMAKRGHIRRRGYDRACRVTSHGRVLAVWERC